MNDLNAQIIETDGTPQFAVLPIERYREIVSLLKDIEDYSAIDRVLVDDKEGKTVPSQTVNAILSGVSPLRAWREYRGLTLKSLAKRLGVSKGYLSQIENGRKPGTLDLFRRISVILNVTIDDLIQWNDRAN